MINKKESIKMMTPRTLKEARFKDVKTDVDHYVGSKQDPGLIGKYSFWSNLMLSFDNYLLNRKKKK